MSDSDPKAATSGRRIAYHSLLNLVGAGSPLLVAVFAIPVLIDRLGTERFGVLTIVWVLIGYLSLFDLGIGRALTKLVAERTEPGQAREAAALARTGLLLLLVMGTAGGALTAAMAPWLVENVLVVPPELRQETRVALLLLATSLPVVILTTGLRGLLEAYHRFDLVNLVRTPLGIFTFAGPLLVLPVSTHLGAVVGILLAARIGAAAVQWVFVRRLVPVHPEWGGLDRAAVPVLLRFGGWMTVSGTISPLMVYLDRFLIGATLGMAAVAYYATPFEIVIKLLLVPGALVAVLFPTFSAGIRRRDPQMPRLFGHALLAVLLTLAPLTLLIVTYGGLGLQLWVGAEFAARSALVLQWLAVGVLINALAHIPFTVLQGAGRPDLTAKLHLAELPIYLVGVWYLSTRFGITGAAIAWALRAALDAVFLFILVPRVLPNTGPWLRRMVVACGVLLVVLPAGAVVSAPLPKAVFLAAVLLTGLPAAWLLLPASERGALRGRARLLWGERAARQA